MGYVYDVLIPSAILFSNPGVTREEFVQLLDTTYRMDHRNPPGWKKTGSTLRVDAGGKYHAGLEGLARILCLDETEAYRSFTATNKDEYGLYLHAPCKIDKQRWDYARKKPLEKNRM